MFPSDPKFIKLKKWFKELKILTSTYEGLYQAIKSTIFAPNTLEFDLPLSLDSDNITFAIVTELVSFGKNTFLRQIVQKLIKYLNQCK